jgi:hypothetical protein
LDSEESLDMTSQKKQSTEAAVRDVRRNPADDLFR